MFVYKSVSHKFKTLATVFKEQVCLAVLSIHGFPKVATNTDTHGAMSSKTSHRKQKVLIRNLHYLVLLLVISKRTLSILELLMKCKKKKELGVLNGSFLSSLVEGGHSFYISLKGTIWMENRDVHR